MESDNFFVRGKNIDASMCADIAEVDDCQFGPCMNDATCIDQFNRYTCICQNGFTGSNCETSKYTTLMETTAPIVNRWTHQSSCTGQTI